jgi:hypothetical protein
MSPQDYDAIGAPISGVSLKPWQERIQASRRRYSSEVSGSDDTASVSMSGTSGRDSSSHARASYLTGHRPVPAATAYSSLRASAMGGGTARGGGRTGVRVGNAQPSSSDLLTANIASSVGKGVNIGVRNLATMSSVRRQVDAADDPYSTPAATGRRGNTPMQTADLL